MKDSENGKPQSENEEFEEISSSEDEASRDNGNEDELTQTSQENIDENYYNDGYDELYDEEEVPKKRGNILVDLFNKVESFKLDMFKKEKAL
ncbi:hypothetical protein [Sulfurimonas indica]|uniref:hypothetical protein n=1 Tax=Sulfurimonas indica TaxID=2508707 RepID=UPI0012657233|nr:hypothetical protein [Sulfurimonas indica]